MWKNVLSAEGRGGGGVGGLMRYKIGTVIAIQGDPEKTERDTSYNMWMQQLVSVYEVISPEKRDTKINNFGSVVYFL